MNTEYYEAILDRVAKVKMIRWNFPRFKNEYPHLLATICEAMKEVDSLEYRKLVTEMRQAQNDYFACRDTSKKKGLLARATDLERRVDKFKVDLPPAPSHTQKQIFD